MTQPFILKLTDNLNTVDFISEDVRVMDGGFDISTPRVKRDLGILRPGVYAPTGVNYETRESKLKFAIYGDTRADILAQIQKIERILRQADARVRTSAGRRVELSYAWEGANGITYFEVYGGNLSFPDDLLSVEKIHATGSGRLMLPDCELTLSLSPYGYGISLYSTSLIPVPLYNPSVGSKTTNPVKVQNPKTGQYNYVQIEGTDLPGSSPLICKLILATDTPYSSWRNLYIGVQHEPYPSKLIFDSNATAYGVFSGVQSDAAAEGGSYKYGSAANRYDQGFSTWAWSLDNNTRGMFYAFYHAGTTVPDNQYFAIGVDDYVVFGMRFFSDYVAPLLGDLTVPLGAIQIPPTRLELMDMGTIDPSLWLGLWVVIDSDSGGTVTMDNLSLLPIGNGLRMLRHRRPTNTAGTYIDDGWLGMEYFKANGTNYVSNPIYGVLDPLRLEPNTNQRLYFTSIGSMPGLSDEKQRAFKVQLMVVPTYLTMAL